MQKLNRVLVIGLDGATWDVLDPWIRDGSLPNLARLRQSGSWGALRSTLPPLTATAWSTFMTGKRPGKHGVFHFVDLFGQEKATANGKSKIVNARSIKSSTLWDIAAHHQRKVVVINLPMTYPPRPVNGTLITCFLTPKNASVFTYPPELSAELTDYVIDLDRFIDIKPYESRREGEAIAPSLSLIQEFRDMTDKRARTALSLMDSQSWDFFMVVFMSTDRMGHYLWPYHRPPKSTDSPEIRALCQAVHQHYVRLDEVVGELTAKAGKDTTVIVVSDHGMGAKFTKRVHGNNWLLQHGWLRAQSNGVRDLTNIDSWFRRLGLPRDKIGRALMRMRGLRSSSLVKRAAKSRAASVDTEKSQVYFVPIYDNIAGIHLNGVNGSEALRQKITQELMKLVDPETGETIVERVCLGTDYYNGPFANNIPDMIVIAKPGYGWSFEVSHYSTFVTKTAVTSLQGDHRLEGIFVANGPEIVANPTSLLNLAIEDVAPTILYLMGLPVPSDLDGRVLTEVVAPNIVEAQPVRYGEPLGFWPRQDKVTFLDEIISDEDEAEIRSRLQALGYLE